MSALIVYYSELSLGLQSPARALKRATFTLVPAAMRIQGRSYFSNYLLDIADFFSGRRDPQIPPRHLNISGEGPFRKFGEHNLMLCRTLGNLQPNDSVLDIGCGIGRTALALTSFLEAHGRYAGFDIIDFAIRWCRRNIGKRHSNFWFVHSDVYNKTYNPRGKTAPDQYVFPFPDASFTFALATSVFTHILPSTAEHYVAETSRVLRPGQQLLSTWFLIDAVSEAGMASGLANMEFPHRYKNHAQHKLYAPELAVAYESRYVREIFTQAGFAVKAIHRGGWSGAPGSIDSSQDVVVAERV